MFDLVVEVSLCFPREAVILTREAVVWLSMPRFQHLLLVCFMVIGQVVSRVDLCGLQSLV